MAKIKYRKGGGLSRSKDFGSKKKPYPSVQSKDFASKGRSYPIPTKADAVDALRLAGLHERSDVRTKVFKKYPSLKKEKGGTLSVSMPFTKKIKINNMTTTRKKVKTSKVPKYILGTLLSLGSTAYTIGSGISAANKAKRQALKDRQDEERLAINQAQQEDALELEEFQEEGVGNISFYQAKGGKLAKPMSYNTKGGRLKPLSSDTEEAKGNKHNESTIDNTTGIKLLQGNKPFAEIEDGEVIKDGKKVFSDVTTIDGKRTYAEIAKTLATKKGKLEKEINKGNSINRATTKRKLVGIDQAEDALFADQESRKTTITNNTTLVKGRYGIDFAETDLLLKKGKGEKKSSITKGSRTIVKMQEGADIDKLPFEETTIGKGLGEITPFIDNIANAILTGKTPKISKPRLIRSKPLKTSVNVSSELAAIKDATEAASRNIARSTSSSATARSAIASTRLQGAKQTGQILASKENRETALKNQAALNRQKVEQINLAKLDRFGERVTARESDVQGRISANIADLSGDIIDKRNFKAQQAFDRERLDIAKQQFGIEGTTRRADLANPTEIQKLNSDSTYAKQQYNKYKGTAEEAEFLRLVPRFKLQSNTKTLAIPNINR